MNKAQHSRPSFIYFFSLTSLAKIMMGIVIMDSTIKDYLITIQTSERGERRPRGAPPILPCPLPPPYLPSSPPRSDPLQIVVIMAGHSDNRTMCKRPLWVK